MVTLLTKPRDDFKYEVRISVYELIRRCKDKVMMNEIYPWVVETYGMPGNRYMYHPALDIVFRFRDEQDAVWFSLRWS